MHFTRQVGDGVQILRPGREVFANLTPGEISGQIMAAQEDLGERISNVVLMGSGEPFDNADNVFKFLENAISPDGLGIGARHITISTCGILSGIKRLADSGISVNLSVSLHATDDETRRKIMPIAKSMSINEIVWKGRILIKQKASYLRICPNRGVNDTAECAEALSKLHGVFMLT